MIDILLDELHEPSVKGRMRRANLSLAFVFLAFMGIVCLTGLMVWRSGPTYSPVAMIIFLTGAIAILYQPRYGIYLLIFWGLVGDGALLPWYPFGSNFSTVGSLLYLHDAVIISPLEAYIAITFVSWFARLAVMRKMNFYVSPLTWPALFFAVFITIGLVWGILRGGVFNIALLEARAIYYLVAMIILTSNLIETRAQVNKAIWFAMIALFIEGIVGTYTYFVVLEMDLGGVESMTEHSAAIHMNTMFIFIMALWIYKGSTIKRVIIPLMAPVVFLTYIAAQRRSAFLTLGIAVALLFIILFLENKKVFFIIVPPLMVIGVIYTAAFWNKDGALGIPAQAVKSIVAEDQATEKDQSSNIYRMLENTNVMFTIQQEPIMGIGFGHKFYIVAPMPDISFFDLWQYFPHNSIMWMWMKAGVGGFVSMLLLIGSSIMLGVRVLLRMPKNDLSAIALTATLYIIMHFLFAYVDISWSGQSMLYVGMMMGLLACLERIVAKPVPVTPRRWQWQAIPKPEPGLRPLPNEVSA